LTNIRQRSRKVCEKVFRGRAVVDVDVVVVVDDDGANIMFVGERKQLEMM
jgi:hypothetical protein